MVPGLSSWPEPLTVIYKGLLIFLEGEGQAQL
jgi:hypothetical protein